MRDTFRVIVNQFYTRFPALALRYRKLVKYGFEMETTLVKKYLSSSRRGLFVDIGAHLGSWSYALASRRCSVIAIEPNPVLAGLLRRSRIVRTQVIEAALGDSEGSAVLQVPIIGGLPRPGNGTTTHFRMDADQDSLDLVVSQTTLDSLALDFVKAIKIDCEGGEMNVVKGGMGTLEEFRPLLVVELHHDRQEELEEIFGLLRNLDYEVLWFSTAGSLEVGLVGIQERETENVIFCPRRDLEAVRGFRT